MTTGTYPSGDDINWEDWAEIATAASVPTGGTIFVFSNAGVELRLLMSGDADTYLNGDGSFTAPDGFAPADHDATHLAAGSDPIPNATVSSNGLLPQLSGLATQYLDGGGNFSVPATALHATAHITGGADPIPVATDMKTGLLPVLSMFATQYLDGTGAFSVPPTNAHQSTHISGGTDVIPVVTQSNTGLCPVLSGVATEFLRADGVYAVPAGGGGGGGAPDPHAASHVGAGGDVIPLADASNSGFMPALSADARQFLAGDGSWVTSRDWTIIRAGGADYQSSAGERIFIAGGVARDIIAPDPTGFADGVNPVQILQGEAASYNQITSGSSNLRPAGSTAGVASNELLPRYATELVWNATDSEWHIAQDSESYYYDVATADPSHGIVAGKFVYLDVDDKPVLATNDLNEPAPLLVTSVDGDDITFRYSRVKLASTTWDIDPLSDGSNDRYAYLDASGDFIQTPGPVDPVVQVVYFLQQSPYDVTEAWFADVRNHAVFGVATTTAGTFASIAAIAASTSLTDGAVYEVLGLQGGEFLFDETAADTVDNGTIFAVTSGGRLFRQDIESSFTLENFGCVGDGAVDDTTGLANAATYTNQNGKVLRGASTDAVYLTTATVAFANRANLDLAGATIKQADAAELTELVTLSLGDFANRELRVTVDGNKANNTAAITGIQLGTPFTQGKECKLDASDCDTGVRVQGNVESSHLVISGRDCGLLCEYTEDGGNTPDENEVEIFGHSNDRVFECISGNFQLTGIVKVHAESTSGTAVYVSGNSHLTLSGFLRGTSGTTGPGIFLGEESGDGDGPRIVFNDFQLLGASTQNTVGLHVDFVEKIQGSILIQGYPESANIDFVNTAGGLEINADKPVTLGRVGNANGRLKRFATAPSSVLGGGVEFLYSQKNDIQTVSLEPRPSLINATVTFSGATITAAGHGANDNDSVEFTTTGSLPAELSTGTTYRVINSTANDFEVAASHSGTAIVTSGAGSGTHTCSGMTISGWFSSDSVDDMLRVNADAVDQNFTMDPTTVTSSIRFQGGVSDLTEVTTPVEGMAVEDLRSAFGNGYRYYDGTNWIDTNGSFETEIQTTDATPTDCGTYNPGAGSNGRVYVVTALVAGVDPTNDESVGYVLSATFQKHTAVMDQIGSTTVDHTAESAALSSADVAFTVDVDDSIDVTVTGVASRTINWKTKMTVLVNA